MASSSPSPSQLQFDIEHKNSKSLINHHNYEKGNLRSHQVVFSLSNTITGPNLILLPLLFLPTGLITAIVLTVFFGLVSYKTCYLTVMHVKPHEPEYLFAIRRILGPVWMVLYLIVVVMLLWVVGIVFYIVLDETIYAGIYDITSSLGSTALASPSSLVFNKPSIQWSAVLLGIIIFAFVSMKDISKIVSLSSKGEIGIVTALFFLLYIGFKAIVQGKVSLLFDTKYSQSSIPLFSGDYSDIFQLIGFYGAAYLLHFFAVPILRTCEDPSKKPKNLFLSYICTGFVYAATGLFGAFGTYWRFDPSNPPNSMFDLFTSDEKDVFVLAIITQCAVAFQLITVIPVINYLARDQLFSLIWRDDENKKAPEWAFHGWNLLFVLSLVGCQILNLSPSNLMTYLGTFGGFIIVYLVPCVLHLKSYQIFQENREELQSEEKINKNTRSESVVSSVHREESYLDAFKIYPLYLSIIALGVGVVVVNLYISFTS